jgi:hypothetical protein
MQTLIAKLVAEYWDDRGFGTQGIYQSVGPPGKLQFRYLARLKETYFRGVDDGH